MSKVGEKHTVVIGGGIVGACTALELIRAGQKVTIVDLGEPGGRQAASYGHGCWISPASVVPMSLPGLWKQVPSYLMNPKGPLVIRWRHFPTLLPWLVRFLLAGASVRKVESTAQALSWLLRDSPERHQVLSEKLGMPDLIRRDGLLYAYPDRRAFEREALAWHLRRITGLRWRELDRTALALREPGLDEHYSFGILAEDGAHCIDPGAYVARIAKAALADGAQLVRARVSEFVFEDDRLSGVRTDQGTIACSRAVVAAGAWSKALARCAGDRIPLESERGYHGVVSLERGGPRHPVMPSDGKMANTPTTQGLRLSGQVELASIDAPPNWRRVDILLEHARKTYPALAKLKDIEIDRWMGHRPSTPDGLPVIGRSSRSPDVFYAFGHGHVGFASGPITGSIVAQQITGNDQPFNIRPYSPRRFRLGRYEP
ncbi:FAD-binding oxidoreductase [Pararhizobium sp. BT-229]|uniref:NAD(P)/FAD-dependent oxidoreductase n=1 Tax=Pararhizobium sp. BT-229 TaxID=2986923 RepID=UPI0021F78B71|nr:FAD-binding oxidoreductase [Pararhizobium sp. BT-229]MCV9960460.1 FAD-binding oxidoreductase [Pararhizobium sp. BT-229]